MSEPAVVSFEVLFRTAGSGTLPSAATRETFRPGPDAVQSARHWLEARGATCHDTGFSLACTAPATLFRSLFGGLDTRRVPAGLAPWVDEISVPRPPDFF
jgi:hypothetical protein